MQIYTLPALARALGVTYPVVYSLRSRGLLQPTQRNGSRDYYTLDDYRAAAQRSVAHSTVIGNSKEFKYFPKINYNDLL
jgi:hypothetical protein